MSVCAKFQLSSWSRSGIKVPGGGVKWGVVGCGVVAEANFSVQFKPNPSCTICGARRVLWALIEFHMD